MIFFCFNKYYYSVLCVVLVQAMVQYNRLELLTHPVCQKYLEMKW